MGQVILWQPITHILWKEQILLGKVRSIGFCHVQNCHILPVGFNANQGLKIEYSDTLLVRRALLSKRCASKLNSFASSVFFRAALDRAPHAVAAFFRW